MSTRATRDSERKGFHREQEKLGGIKPAQLPDGTIILVETSTYMYQITKDGDKFVVDTGAPICRNNKIAGEIHSHYAKLKYNMEDWIGFGMRILFKFVDGANVLTGEVTGASIRTKDYTYELWT